MKANKLIKAASLMLLALLAVTMVACSDPVSITGVSVDNSGVRTSVTISAAADYSTAGLAVYADYSDGSRTLMSSDQYTVNSSAVTGAAAEGTYTVTIAANGATVITGVTGLSTSYDVTVTADTFSVDTSGIPASASVQETALDTWFASNVSVKDTSGSTMTYGTGYTLAHTINSDGTITFKVTSASDGTYVRKTVSGVTVLYTGSLTVSLTGLSDNVTVKVTPAIEGVEAQTISASSPSVTFSDINVGSYSFAYEVSDTTIYTLTGYSTDGGDVQDITASIPFTIGSGTETKVALSGRYLAGTATFSLKGASILEGTTVTVSVNGESLKFTKDDSADKSITNLRIGSYPYTVEVSSEASIYGYAVDSLSGTVVINTDNETVETPITGSYQYGALEITENVPSGVTVTATLYYNGSEEIGSDTLTASDPTISFARLAPSDDENFIFYRVVYSLDAESEKKYTYTSGVVGISVVAGETKTVSSPDVKAATNSVTFNLSGIPDGVTVTVDPRVDGLSSTLLDSSNTSAYYDGINVGTYNVYFTIYDTYGFGYALTDKPTTFGINKNTSTIVNLTGSSSKGSITVSAAVDSGLSLTDDVTVTATVTKSGEASGMNYELRLSSTSTTASKRIDGLDGNAVYTVSYAISDENYRLSTTEAETVTVAAGTIYTSSVTLKKSGHWYVDHVSGTDYEISTAAELQELAWIVNGDTSQTLSDDNKTQITEANSFDGETVVLTSDIDLSSISNWPRIGNAIITASFNGTFDGKGHEISNLKIDSASGFRPFVGLFGFIENATIQNLTIRNANISAGSYIGVVAGGANYFEESTSKILNVTVYDSTVDCSSSSEVGGVIGSLRDGTMEISGTKVSTKTGTTTINGRTGGTGGLVGTSVATSAVLTINSSGIEGITVSGTTNVGGLIGTSTSTSVTVSECYNTNSSVTASGSGAGGIVGAVSEGNNTTSTDNAGSYTGNTVTLTSGKISGTTNVAGIIGLMSATRVVTITDNTIINASDSTISATGTSADTGYITALFNSSTSSNISGNTVNGASYTYNSATH